MKMPRRRNKADRLARNPRLDQRGSSAPVMRYYRPEQGTLTRQGGDNRQPSAQSSSPRTKVMTPGKVLGGLLRWVGVLAVAFVLLANLTLSNFAVLSAEDRSDNNNSYHFRSETAYRDIIKDVLNDSILNRTKLTLSSRKVETQIRARLPEVDQVSVIIPLAGRKLQVKLGYAKPLMRLIGTDNRQGVVGENGVIFIKDDASVINQSFAALPSLTVPNLDASPGQQILTTDETALLTLLKTEFDGSDEARPLLKGVEFMIEQRELRVRFSGVNYYAKLTSEERNPRDQVGSLVASLRQFKEQGTLPTEYVDVRVHNRVFMK